MPAPAGCGIGRAGAIAGSIFSCSGRRSIGSVLASDHGTGGLGTARAMSVSRRRSPPGRPCRRFQVPPTKVQMCLGLTACGVTCTDNAVPPVSWLPRPASPTLAPSGTISMSRFGHGPRTTASRSGAIAVDSA